MTDAADLARISDDLHDEWFDLDRVSHDLDRSELRVTIYPGRVRGRIIQRVRPPSDDDLPEPLGELVVRSVVGVDITDRAEIGWYDFGGLDYDPDANRLTLRSNFPMEISMTVTSLDLELIRSPKPA